MRPFFDDVNEVVLTLDGMTSMVPKSNDDGENEVVDIVVVGVDTTSSNCIFHKSSKVKIQKKIYNLL